MTLSIPAATDHIVTLAQQAVVGITINGEPVAVEDGWPGEDGLTWGMFVVGVSEPPPDIQGETAGTRMWAQLGAKRVEEDYTIPCYIIITIGEATQKQVRDLAASIFDAFWSLLAADLTLGGVLSQGRFAELENLTFVPARVGAAAEPGRRQLITFSVRCRNVTN